MSCRLYLAGGLAPVFSHYSGDEKRLLGRINRMASYHYMNAWDEARIHMFKDFMLDSGAFSFTRNAILSKDWDRYVDEYGDFVKANRVGLFYELDIDNVVGVPEVLRLRKRLEKRVGRRCIPVWHHGRGKNGWLDLCAEYEYVAIGGIAKGDERTERWFRWFTNAARERNCKVHGLGYTRLNDKVAYSGFDSIDSTSWLAGNRYGFVYIYRNGKMGKVPTPEGMRVKTREVREHNLLQWVLMGEEMESGVKI